MMSRNDCMSRLLHLITVPTQATWMVCAGVDLLPYESFCSLSRSGLGDYCSTTLPVWQHRAAEYSHRIDHFRPKRIPRDQWLAKHALPVS